MRTAGVIDDVRGLGLHDHVCWVYDDPDNFGSRVREFLADGLGQGQRVCYLACGDVEKLMADLRDLDGLELALRRGAVQVMSLDAAYPAGTVVEPAEVLQTFAAATQEALTAGFTGLRIAAEVTSLVRTPRQLEAFARFEHQVDRYMTSQPVSAMCAYNRAELSKDAIAQLACLHPNVNSGVTGFRLHASNHAAACLDGELDMATVELFCLALERAELRPTSGELVIDAAGLTFIDHRNLLVLAEHARHSNATAVLHTAWSGSARLVELLGLRDLRVERLG